MMPSVPCSYAVAADHRGSACWEVCAGGLCVRDRSRVVAENLLACRFPLAQSNSQHQPLPGPSGDQRADHRRQE